MKDPDGVYESIKDAAEASVYAVKGVSEEERDDLIKSRQKQITEDLGAWLEYSEYLTVEFDLEEGTATVLKN